MTKQEWNIGDCLELLPTIEDKSIDMILTDLPYGTTACKWDAVIPFEPLWEQYYRILRPNGFIVLTGSQPFTTQMIHSNINNFSHQWIWEKEQGVNPLLANMMPMKTTEDIIVFSNEYKKWDTECIHPQRLYFKKVLDYIGLNLREINIELGHRKAEHSFYINSTQYSLMTSATYNELIEKYKINEMIGYVEFDDLHKENQSFKKDAFDGKYPRVYNPQKTKGKPYVSGLGTTGDVTGNVKKVQTINNGDRMPTTILKFNRETGLHPTQKPIPLAEYLIKTYTNEGDKVHDSCMGSGWSLHACRNLNRNYVGFEISDEWESHYKINDSKLDVWL